MCISEMSLISQGKEFQSVGAANANALSPKVREEVFGMVRRF